MPDGGSLQNAPLEKADCSAQSSDLASDSHVGHHPGAML